MPIDDETSQQNVPRLKNDRTQKVQEVSQYARLLSFAGCL
jgi:hypothetical protein